ncbi:MAG: CRISPR-associated protein Cas4 [Burkholderiaceae bacterium]|nr:CRISPR-associated protein Cas4 [Burkholderiaceae bacterium]
MNFSEEDIISIGKLNDYLFCPRRCALHSIEGIWIDNAHTAKGTLVHEHADFAGYESTDGVKALRALVLYSKAHGLSGRADIVEVRAVKTASGVSQSYAPVEYKKGKRRQFDNDEVQLCAQALCLEEMFATKVERGFIFHATTKRRREVVFDDALHRLTLETIEAVRVLLASGVTPPARLLPRCDGCSLRGVCLPEISDPTLGASDAYALMLKQNLS